MDNVLLPFLSTNDERERQQHLAELLTLRAAPLIRAVLLRRLGFYVSAQGVNQNNEDAEDLYQEAITRVAQSLDQLQSSSGADIENFELYVSRLVANLCIDFLRAKSPARTRLKYRLRDLLKRHEDLLTWERDGEILCGFARWRDTRNTSFSGRSFHDVEAEVDSFQSQSFGNENICQLPLSQIVIELFTWVGGPVEIDLLVGIVAHLLDVRDHQIDSLAEQSGRRWNTFFGANTESSESNVEANDLLARLWRTVITLSPQQRDAFVFGFEDETGHDLFTILLAAEVVNWDKLAEGMGRSVEDVIRLRQRMPMDNITVADELRASRANVYKWRFRAIRRLKAELGQ